MPPHPCLPAPTLAADPGTALARVRSRRPAHALWGFGWALLLGAAAGCGADSAEGSSAQSGEAGGRLGPVLERALADIDARADSVDDVLQPVALLRPAEERDLRRYLNDAQLARARSLGVRPDGEAALDSLERAGRLVRLPDSTRYWVIRELDHSVPWVVPDVERLLTSIGERFHARLAEMGLPPFRMEVSSLLRTAESQADLRSDNVNAARGTSTHEYATTIDVAYNGFSAPQEPFVELELDDDARWLEPHLGKVVTMAAERVAGRRSRELQAVLGKVLQEVQAEGAVMVTLETLQPVFHMTVARRLDDG